MSERQSLTLTSGAGSDLAGAQYNVDSDALSRVSTTVPDNTTNQPLGLDWAANKLTAFFMTVSVDCTLKVNSTSSPTDTIPLKAGVPLVWIKDAGGPALFTGTAGAVTELYLTVPAGDPDPVDCDVVVRASIDF